MAEYFRKTKLLADTMAAAGRPLASGEFNTYLLAGLGSEYDSLVTSVTTRFDPPSPEELFSHLLTHEARLLQQALALTTSSEITANATSKQASPRGRNGGRGRGFHRGYRGRGRGRFSPQSSPFTEDRPTCQVCFKSGHTALQCYNRFNHAFQAPPPASFTANYSSIPAGPDSYWYPDSAASNHMTHDYTNLSHNPTEYTGEEQVRVGDGSALPIHHTGGSSLSTPSRSLRLSNLLHVPLLTKNLISVRQFCADNSVFFEFHADSFCVKDLRTKELLLRGPTKHGLYVFPSTSTEIGSTSSPQAYVGERTSVPHWHHRLGHPSLQVVRKILHRFQLPVDVHPATSGLCSACCQAKSHTLPFSRSTSPVTRPLQLLFMDVWGPAPMLSRDGFRFYFSIVDVFSRYTWLFPIRFKSDVYSQFIKFQHSVERFFDLRIASVQTDWGGEFRSLHTYLVSQGITHRLSCPHTHQQQGTVERKHRHIVETGLALLTSAALPQFYWADAFQTAVYLINRLPSPVTRRVSPYFLLFHKHPDYTILRIFGTTCYPHLRPYTSHKLDPRSLPCLFLGYSPSHRGYICLHLPTSRVYISRNVVFDESHFPYRQSSAVSSAPTHTSPSTHTALPLALSLSPPHVSSSVSSPSSTEPPVLDSSSSPSVTSSGSSAPHRSFPHDISSTPSPSSAPIVTRSHHNIQCPKVRTDGTIPWPPPRAHVTTTAVPFEPTSVSEALKFSEWRAAMNEEFQALMTTRTWTLVPPSPSQNVLGCKWVFRTKFHSDGSLERRKARLVAKGFHQQVGLDYVETFSPVIKPSTVRLVLSIAVQSGWSLRQLDVQNAFLHGDLQEIVHMAQPTGFIHPDYPHFVCKLNRSLYGLKQAPRAWFSKLSSKLLELGFSASRSDSSLFTFIRPHLQLYFLVYVDDIVITGSDASAIDHLIASLQADFPLKDLGQLHYFLGVEVHHLSNGLLLTQQKYIADLLRRTNMSTAKLVHTPMATTAPLSARDGTAFEDPTLYRSVVGSLQYLSFTRPDLSYAVNRVCQYMHAPRTPHWQAVKRILRYLRFSAHFGLFYSRSSSRVLSAYSDADWAGCPDDRRSTGGSCVFFGSHLITWSSRKQPTIARSSTEAEYKAVANATCELLWVQALLRDLGVSISSPPVLWCDNLGATYLTSNPVMHSRTKHVEVDYHFVRDRVASKSLRVSFLSSKDQLADLFTKPLSVHRFSMLRTSLAVHPLQLGSRGAVRISSAPGQCSSFAAPSSKSSTSADAS
ncbi:Retrovirus-related Pol polyprotein from transposon TNT 1-94 [Morella rubra]|uniref:Retrovirus-related Pol polyprotein from transposon TNT 1-94 n=1 Tax=Morella rubra TaxID=262757 RepID=A0A6A1WRJ5_9ROSI|nr:Retrovirus-related Pol polyprotein from transposon TNT 1-94 [Morella rubra]